MSSIEITVIDDDPSICELFNEAFDDKYAVETYADGEAGMEGLEESQPDILILDLRLPGKGGLEILEEATEQWPDMQVIMVTAHKDVESAVKAMKLGAFDYVVKPFDLDEIEVVIEKSLENKELKEEVRDLRTELGQTAKTDLIGQSKPMQDVRKRISKIVKADSNVLIRGESGTGKEVVANQLHTGSERSDEPLIPVNCAALPHNLLESELFGYEKGAFTGAERSKKGKIEMADGGTLFLDEIGAMPLDMQAKLLRVLETKTVTPVGSEEAISLDFRLLSATSANIEEMIQNDEFREDLFYRINVVSIGLPPLRDRKADIPELCEHFLQEINKKLDRDIEGISEEAMDLLTQHDWPGNVRELRNALESAAIVGESAMLQSDDFNLFRINAHDGNEVDGNLQAGMSLEDAEEILIQKTLDEYNGNITQSAEKLGITRKTLRNKKEKYDLE